MTMLSGGKCDYYELGTQLADAAEFIKTNRVVLITLSIGGDNVLSCFNLLLFQVNLPCVGQGLAAIGPQLGQILEHPARGGGPQRANRRDELLRPAPRRLHVGP